MADPKKPEKKPRAAKGSTVVAAAKADVAEALELQTIIDEIVAKELLAGRDFGISHRKGCPQAKFGGPGRCPSCDVKADLWLPGAERVVKLRGYRFGNPEIAEDMMKVIQIDAPWIAFRVPIVRRRDGEIVGWGIGARSLARSGGDPNTMIKMAKKSACIDGAKSTFSLSGHFTQDSPDAPPPAPELPPPPPPPPPPAPPPTTGDMLQAPPPAPAPPPMPVVPPLPPTTGTPPPGPPPPTTGDPPPVPAPVYAGSPPAPPPRAPHLGPPPAPAPPPPPPPPVDPATPATTTMNPDHGTPSLDKFIEFYAPPVSMLQKLYWCAGWTEGPVTMAQSRKAYQLCEQTLSAWITSHGGWPDEAKTWTAEQRGQKVFGPWLDGLEDFYKKNPEQRGE